jgi:isoamylase
MSLLIHRGRALPLGLSCRGLCGMMPEERGSTIVNFSLHSRSARSVELRLHQRDSGALLHQIPLDILQNRTGEVWHIEIGNLDLPIRYSWFVNGHPLVDPRAQALKRNAPFIDSDGTESKQPSYHGLFPLAPRQWKHLRPARVAMQDLVVYEMHVKGFTAHPSSGVRSPGQYAGIIEKLPYLKDLGVKAIELMPVHEFDPTACVFINPETGKGLQNYWGYDPVGLMAPATCYSAQDDPLLAVEEFREMVDACHGAGLEVILDVVLNHTAEGAAEGPNFNFRGLDEDLWYMQTPDGKLMDFTGCGNTFNCNHPVVRAYILDCLRAWVVDMGVDGFRFDLAAVLGRDTDGHVLENAPVLEAIFADPVLANTRLIAEAWDAAGLVQVGDFQTRNEDAAVRPAGDWAEWNGSFRDCMRRLVR